MANSGEVCSQKSRFPAGRTARSSENGSRCRSTTVSAERMGVSTSRKPRSWKNSRSRRSRSGPQTQILPRGGGTEVVVDRHGAGRRAISSAPLRSPKR